CAERNGSREEPKWLVLPDALVLDAERVSSPPQNAGTAPAQSGLLEVEALQQVERTKRDEQRDGNGPRALTSLAQVQGGNDQRQACRDRDRVEQRHSVHRQHLEQQMTAPRDVRRRGGGEVDDADP